MPMIKMFRPIERIDLVRENYYIFPIGITYFLVKFQLWLMEKLFLVSGLVFNFIAVLQRL